MIERTCGASTIAACASPRPVLALAFFAPFAMGAPPRASCLRRQGADGLGTLVAMVSCATQPPRRKILRPYGRTIKVDLLVKIAALNLAPSGSKSQAGPASQ